MARACWRRSCRRRIGYSRAYRPRRGCRDSIGHEGAGHGSRATGSPPCGPSWQPRAWMASGSGPGLSRPTLGQRHGWSFHGETSSSSRVGIGARPGDPHGWLTSPPLRSPGPPCRRDTRIVARPLWRRSRRLEGCHGVRSRWWSPRNCLEPGTGRLIDAIAGTGVPVTEIQPASPSGGDLGRIQRLLAGDAPEALDGDGSVLVIHGDTEISAADALASWLAVGSAVEHERTVFMLGAATGVLDAALARRRLPRFCHSPASPSRTALQVLPLAFATRWAPFDPFALMELLLLPQGPVPRSVSASLAKALSEAPGRGSAAWTGALDEATRRRRTKFERDGLAGGALTGRLREDTDRWGAWVRATVHDPLVGMPADEARRVCGMVAGWAARSGPADPLRMQAAAIASELSAAIEQLGESFLPRALLSRMIDEAVGPGVPDPAAEAEACTWSAVHSPGAFWATADTVVWWAPSGAVTPRSGPWTLAEVEELAGSDCCVRNGAMSVAAASRAWRQPIMHAARQVVLVVSKTLDGRVPDEHPLMHELRSVLRDARGVVLRAEDLLRGASDFGGRQCARTLTEVRLLPVPSACGPPWPPWRRQRLPRRLPWKSCSGAAWPGHSNTRRASGGGRARRSRWATASSASSPTLSPEM